jgi:Family of unknown function (DUF5372)
MLTCARRIQSSSSLALGRSGRVPNVRTSIKNADASIPATPLVRVTHPFHPLSGGEFACVGERYNRYGKRLLLRVDDANVCSVPPQWTDLRAPDPEIILGGRRALFRVADLLELRRLVGELRVRYGSKNRLTCNDNSAACVKAKMPHVPERLP